MTDTNEAAGAEALEPVQVAAEQPEEKPATAVAPEGAGEAEGPEAGAENAEGEEAGDKPDDRPKKKGGYHRQIERLNTEKYREKLRADDAERKLAELTR